MTADEMIKNNKFLQYSDAVYDKIYKIDTCGYEYLEENNKILHMNYLPTPYVHLKRLFLECPLSEKDHFVDFGCGKGRVLAVAAKRKCDKITGIDINERMCRITNNNIIHLRGPHCKNIDVQNIDAKQLIIESSMNKFHFFEPFHLKIFANVITNIFNSTKLYDRQIYVYLYQLHPVWATYIDNHTSLKLVNTIYYNNNKIYHVYSNTQ